MTPYLLDDIELDLERTFVSVTGTEWRFTGHWSADGEPLMQSMRSPRSPQPERAVPLPTVDRDHGPLIVVDEDPPHITASAWLPRPAARDNEAAMAA